MKTPEKTWLQPITRKFLILKTLHVNKVLFILLFLLPVAVFAQEGELQDELITIVKNKNIAFPEVQKPQEKALIKLKDLPKLKQKYTYREFGLNLPLLDPKINPPQLRQDKEEPVTNGFARAALGNYGSTLLDLYYNSGRSKDYAWGGFFRHRASANGPVKNSGFSNNDLGAYGMYFTPSFTLSGDLVYSRDRYNFYGYDQERYKNRETDSTRQIFQKVVFRMDLVNAKKGKAFDYQAGMTVGNLSDRFQTSESEIALDGSFRYKIADSSSLGLTTDLSLLKRTTADSSANNRSLWRLNPYYRFAYKGFRIRVGAQLAAVSEPHLNKSGIGIAKENTSSFHFYPTLNLEQDILEGKITAFAGVQGGMNKVSLRNTLETVPFLAQDVYLRHENQKFQILAGAKGNWQGQLSYRSQISFERLEQQAFFVNKVAEREKLVVVYDSNATSRFTWETEFAYDGGEGNRAGLRYRLIRYGMGNLAQPWHLPNSVLTLFGATRASEKILLSGEFYYMGGLRGQNPETFETERLKGLADFNVKGEYFFKKRFTGFLSVHNLLNNKNERFLYYPTQGLRIMVGASATF